MTAQRQHPSSGRPLGHPPRPLPLRRGIDWVAVGRLATLLGMMAVSWLGVFAVVMLCRWLLLALLSW